MSATVKALSKPLAPVTSPPPYHYTRNFLVDSGRKVQKINVTSLRMLSGLGNGYIEKISALSASEKGKFVPRI